MKRIAVVVLVALALSLSAGAQTLTVMTEENAPFNFTASGAAKGISVDLLVEMAARAKLNITRESIQFLPWARSYQMVQDTANTALFSMGRTEAREALFDWVGPIYGLQIGVIAKKSRDINATTVQDLAAYTIGTVRDGAPEQTLISKGADVNKLDRGTSLDSNLKKLIADRVDAVAWNVPAAMYNLSLLGENPENYEVVYVLNALDLYFAFHKDISASVTGPLQTALDAMKRDGTYDRIVKTYIK